MKNVMIDLETLSTRPTAAVLSIGACYFDENGVGETFYRNIDETLRHKFHVDKSTVDWWKGQSPQARMGLLIDQKELVNVLFDFAEWLGFKIAPLMWSNGADFDLPILVNLYSQTGCEPPFKFYNSRCYRTIKNLFPIAPLVRKGEKHNALDDAVSQAEHLIAIRNKALDLLGIDLFNPENTSEKCNSVAFVRSIP